MQIETELVRWTIETRSQPPYRVSDIAQAERDGAIIDLCSGVKFVQDDNWRDFAARWVADRLRRDQAVTKQALAEAMHRAQAGSVSCETCYNMALLVWPLVEEILAASEVTVYGWVTLPAVVVTEGAR